MRTFGVTVRVRPTEASLAIAIEPDDEPAVWLEPVHEDKRPARPRQTPAELAVLDLDAAYGEEAARRVVAVAGGSSAGGGAAPRADGRPLAGRVSDAPRPTDEPPGAGDLPNAPLASSAAPPARGVATAPLAPRATSGGLPFDAPLELDLGEPPQPRVPPATTLPPTRHSFAGPLEPGTSASAMAGAAELAWEDDEDEPPAYRLGRDGWEALLWGLCIGLVVGMLAGHLAVRIGGDRDRVRALEDELAQSYQRPVDVELGDLRTPATIEREYHGWGERARSRFLVVMFAVGAPLGVVLGRLRTPPMV